MRWLLLLSIAPFLIPSSVFAALNCASTGEWDGGSYNEFSEASAGRAQKIGEKFTVSANCTLTEIGVQVSRNSSTANNAYIYVTSDSGGSPGSTLETCGNINITNTSNGSSFSWATSTCAGTTLLSTATTYWVVATANTLADDPNSNFWANTSQSITLGDSKAWNGSSWTTTAGG